MADEKKGAGRPAKSDAQKYYDRVSKMQAHLLGLRLEARLMGDGYADVVASLTAASEAVEAAQASLFAQARAAA